MSVPGTAFERTRDVSNLLNFLSSLLFVLLFGSICWTQIRPDHGPRGWKWRGTRPGTGGQRALL